MFFDILFVLITLYHQTRLLSRRNLEEDFSGPEIDFLLFQMFNSIFKFGLFIAVPTGFYVAGQIASDSSNTGNMIFVLIAAIRAAMLFDGTFIAADIAVVGGMVNAAIADIIIVHGHDNGRERLNVLLSFAIELDIGNISCVSQVVIRSFELDFL